MRVKLTRADEAYGVSRSAMIAGAALVSLGILAAVLGRQHAGPVTCPFRVVTGLPCPTCGLTRTAGHLLRGELAAAFGTNPLDAATMLFAAPLMVGMWAANRLGRWALRVELSRGERTWVWLVTGAALAANWLYVLTSGV
ncbi:MAG: DUF2752 domain-containing protein [Candidatus Eisenbacteria bacterium]